MRGVCLLVKLITPFPWCNATPTKQDVAAAKQAATKRALPSRSLQSVPAIIILVIVNGTDDKYKRRILKTENFFQFINKNPLKIVVGAANHFAIYVCRLNENFYRTPFLWIFLKFYQWFIGYWKMKLIILLAPVLLF